MKKKIVFLKSVDGIDFYIFKPTFLRLYANCYSMEEMPPYTYRALHRARMVREYLKSRYRVVYMKVGDKTIGHFVVGRGGTRIVMSNPEDIVIGPVWIVPSERNKGYASTGIGFILHQAGFEYINAYEYIHEKNTASIRTVENNGFVLAAKCKRHGMLRSIREDENGDLLVYRYNSKV